MKLAIVGPKFSGKTTVFNALSGANEPLSDFSGGGQEHLREVAVPDPRLARLAAEHNPKKVTAAKMELLDLPGYGGSDKFFGDARQHEALLLVVRAFGGTMVPHPKNRVDWKKDLDDLRTDFVVQDLQLVERRIEKLEKAVLKPSKTQKEEQAELDLLLRVRPALEEGVALKQRLGPEEREALSGFGFLTLKPTLVLVNLGDEDDAAAMGVPEPDEAKLGPDIDGLLVPLRARLEAEVAQLDEGDRAGFLADFGLREPIRERAIRLCYRLLGLQSFLTGTGPKEARAWTIRRGATAVDAARVIHSDIAKHFVRAEVLAWADYEACGGWKAAKNQKKVRLEGKDYVMQDGDVVEFRHGG